MQKQSIRRTMYQKLINKLNRYKKALVWNPETGHELQIRSIYEFPIGYELKPYRVSQETKNKMSEAAKKRGIPIEFYRSKQGKNNPTFGKKIYYNPLTLERHFYYEGQEPVGFLAGKL